MEGTRQAEPQTPPEPEPTAQEGKVETPLAPSLTDAQVLEYAKAHPEVVSQALEGWEEQKVYDLPHIRKAIDRYTTHRSKELEQQYSQTANQRLEASRWWNQWQALDDGAKARLIENDPNVGQNLAKVKQILSQQPNQPTVDTTQVAARIWAGAKKAIQDKYPGVNLEDAETKGDLFVAIEAVAVEKERQTVAEMRKEQDAKFAELRALINKGAEQPDRLPSGGARTVSGKFTREQIGEMSPEEYAQNRDAILGAIRKK